MTDDNHVAAVVNFGDMVCHFPRDSMVIGKKDLLLNGSHSFYANSDKTVTVKTARAHRLPSVDIPVARAVETKVIKLRFMAENFYFWLCKFLL